MPSSPAPQQGQPSGTKDETRIQFSASMALDAVIGGLTYHLPNPDQQPIEVMLSDGSAAQLSAGRVVLHGQTLNIPIGLTKLQQISGNGQFITAQPASSKKFDGNNQPTAILEQATGAAGSAAKVVEKVASRAANLVAGAKTDRTALEQSLSDATKGVEEIVSTLNGIPEAFPSDTLSRPGMHTFHDAQSLGRQSSNWMLSVGKLLEGFDGLNPNMQQKVRTEIQQCAEPNGPLQPVVKAMNALSEYPWKSEAPTARTIGPTATAKPVKRAEETPSSADSENPLPYYFCSEWKTPLEDFKSFIKELDNGAGKAELDDDQQTYQTDLKPSQAEGLQDKYPFLVLAYPNVTPDNFWDTIDDKEEFHAIPRSVSKPSTSSEAIVDLSGFKNDTVTSDPLSRVPRALLPKEKQAPYWKKMLSSKYYPVQDRAYKRDESEGRHTTIYVVDNGFDRSFEVRAELDSMFFFLDLS